MVDTRGGVGEARRREQGVAGDVGQSRTAGFGRPPASHSGRVVRRRRARGAGALEALPRRRARLGGDGHVRRRLRRVRHPPRRRDAAPDRRTARRRAEADRAGVRAGRPPATARRRSPADNVRRMSEAFFVPASGGDGRFTGREACIGPWSSELMHGGPPSALLVRACERAADGGEGLTSLRAGIDFLSAVPIGDVEVSARVVRAGRRITLTEAVLVAGGREVLQARTWHVRVADLPALRTAPRPADPTADPTALPPAMLNWRFPYARAMEWRAVSGDTDGPGDAAAWSRARIPVVQGEEPTGLQRAVLTADSGNGISAALDWNAWSFVNIDLDVHLAR